MGSNVESRTLMEEELPSWLKSVSASISFRSRLSKVEENGKSAEQSERLHPRTATSLEEKKTESNLVKEDIQSTTVNRVATAPDKTVAPQGFIQRLRTNKKTRPKKKKTMDPERQ